VTETITFGELSDWFNRLNGELEGMSFRPALEQCKLIAIADVRMNFVNQHDPDGNPWQPLKMRRPRGGNQVLRDRGILMASTGAADNAASVERITDTTLEVGTNLEYAGIHQRGGTITAKRGKYLAIPATAEAQATPARQFPGKLRFIPTRRGGVLVGAGERGNRQGKIQYVLVPSVTIPARPFLGWNEDTLRKCDEAITAYVVQKLSES